MFTSKDEISRFIKSCCLKRLINFTFFFGRKYSVTWQCSSISYLSDKSLWFSQKLSCLCQLNVFKYVCSFRTPVHRPFILLAFKNYMKLIQWYTISFNRLAIS